MSEQDLPPSQPGEEWTENLRQLDQHTKFLVLIIVTELDGHDSKPANVSVHCNYDYPIDAEDVGRIEVILDGNDEQTLNSFLIDVLAYLQSKNVRIISDIFEPQSARIREYPSIKSIVIVGKAQIT